MKTTEMMFAAIAAVVALCVAANAAQSGYMRIDDVTGETKQATGATQTETIGANSAETIKGGEAVVLGALWNGKDTPPKRNARGTANITLKRGVLSESLQRLQREKRGIPMMTLALVGEDGKQVKYELENVLVVSYQTGGGASGDTHEAKISFQSIDW